MIVKINTHPIVKDIHEEYHVKWCGQIINTHPILENGKPIFSIVSKEGHIEVNTTDIKRIENIAKKMTSPRGRASITTDTSYIYVLEENNKKTLMGVVTHDRVKTYNQMYDKFEFNQ